MIGIIGAMANETKKLYEMMTDTEVKVIAGMNFQKGKLQGKDVVVVQCGVGKVNAAVCSQILCDVYHVDAMINTGIAGSLRNEINIGDIVLSTDALHHDMDARMFGYKLGQVPQMDVWEFKADEHLREIAYSCKDEVDTEINMFQGRVVSGDQFIGDHDKKVFLRETFDGFCTEMEGSAIAQTAYLNKVPFLIVRAISDKADDNVEIDYPAFEEKAIEHGVRLILAMLRKL